MLTYKDRAKERLTSASLNLSSPPTGYVELPTSLDFEYAVICADGQWQVGIGFAGGSPRAMSFSSVQSNSSGTTSDIMSTMDFSTNPADVICCISAGMIEKMKNAVELSGTEQSIRGKVTVLSSGTDTFTFSPEWPIPACDVRYVEFDAKVYARNSSGAAWRVWAVKAVHNDLATDSVTTQDVSGASNTDYTITPSIDMTSTKPVFTVDMSNASPSSTDFEVVVTASNIANPSCW